MRELILYILSKIEYTYTGNYTNELAQSYNVILYPFKPESNDALYKKFKADPTSWKWRYLRQAIKSLGNDLPVLSSDGFLLSVRYNNITRKYDVSDPKFTAETIESIISELNAFLARGGRS